MQFSKTSRNRFTSDGANNLETDESDSSILNIPLQYYYKLNLFFESGGEDNTGGKGTRGGKGTQGARGGIVKHGGRGGHS